jgi:hypothetical protein
MGVPIGVVVGVAVGILVVGAIVAVLIFRGQLGGRRRRRRRHGTGSQASQSTYAPPTSGDTTVSYQNLNGDSSGTYGATRAGGGGGGGGGGGNGGNNGSTRQRAADVEVMPAPPTMQISGGVAAGPGSPPPTPASSGKEEAAALAANVPEIKYRKLLAAIKKGQRVAAGNFGEVFRCKLDGQVVAIKRMHFNVDDHRAVQDFRLEIGLLSAMEHPNILPIYGACTVFPNLCFVSEFMERGSLFDVIHKTPAELTWPRRIKIAIEGAAGLEYLHSLNPKVVHRDVKSMNVMIGQDFATRIGDFGISRTLQLSGAELTTQHIAGSPAWMAGEVLRGERSTDKVDVYAYGVILWELLTLALPWSGSTYADLVRVVGLGGQRLRIPEPLPPGCPPGLPSLIGRMCDPTPAMRPSFEQVKQVLIDMSQAAAGRPSAGGGVFGDVDATALLDPLAK